MEHGIGYVKRLKVNVQVQPHTARAQSLKITVLL